MAKKSAVQGQAASDNAAPVEAGHIATADEFAAAASKMTESATVVSNGSAPKETKREKFRRLAGERLPKTMKRLAQIKSLANRMQYDWTEAQVEYIVGNLYAEVESIANAFQGVKKVSGSWQIPE